MSILHYSLSSRSASPPRFLDARLYRLAAFLLRVDLFAFGGGFAALPLLFHEIVTVRGWLDARTFMDGIALGQVTPGPIIITATFVGYLVGGLAGALVATVAIFSPSFVVLVAAAPVLNPHTRSPQFTRAPAESSARSWAPVLHDRPVRLGRAVDPVRALFGAAVLAALARKAGISPSCWWARRFPSSFSADYLPGSLVKEWTMTLRRTMERLIPEPDVRRYLAAFALVFAASVPVGGLLRVPVLTGLAKAFTEMTVDVGEMSGGTVFLLILANSLFSSLLLLLTGLLAGVLPSLSVAANGLFME